MRSDHDYVKIVIFERRKKIRRSSNEARVPKYFFSLVWERFETFLELARDTLDLITGSLSFARLFLTGYKRPDRSTAPSKIRVSFINSLYRWMETGDTPLYASFSRPEFQFVAVIFLPRIGPLYLWRDTTRKSRPAPRYPSTLLGSRCYLLTTPLY